MINYFIIKSRHFQKSIKIKQYLFLLRKEDGDITKKKENINNLR